MAGVIRELTGDWIHEIQSCDEIQAADRRYHDEVVYFGPKTDLVEGDVFSPKVKRSKAWDLIALSMVDRYNYDEQKVGFFHILHPCKKNYGLDIYNDYVVFFNGDQVKPTKLLYKNDPNAY